MGYLAVLRFLIEKSFGVERRSVGLLTPWYVTVLGSLAWRISDSYPRCIQTGTGVSLFSSWSILDRSSVDFKPHWGFLFNDHLTQSIGSTFFLTPYHLNHIGISLSKPHWGFSFHDRWTQRIGMSPWLTPCRLNRIEVSPSEYLDSGITWFCLNIERIPVAPDIFSSPSIAGWHKPLQSSSMGLFYASTMFLYFLWWINLLTWNTCLIGEEIEIVFSFTVAIDVVYMQNTSRFLLIKSTTSFRSLLDLLLNGKNSASVNQQRPLGMQKRGQDNAWSPAKVRWQRHHVDMFPQLSHQPKSTTPPTLQCSSIATHCTSVRS